MLAVSTPLLGFGAGVATAWLQRKTLAKERNLLLSRSFLLTLLFGMSVVSPLLGYFVLYAPAWSTAYLLAEDVLPRFWAPVLILISGASLPAGFAASAPSVRALAATRVALLGGLSSGVGLLVLLATLPRLRLEGSYQQYRDHTDLTPLVGSRLGYALIWASLVLSVALVGLWRLLAEERRSQ